MLIPDQTEPTDVICNRLTTLVKTKVKMWLQRLEHFTTNPRVTVFATAKNTELVYSKQVQEVHTLMALWFVVE